MPLAREAYGGDMLDERSPVSPHAITLPELKEMAPGTQLVRFNVNLLTSSIVAFVRVDDTHLYVRPMDTPTDTCHEERHHLTDSGLVPYESGWNKSNIIIRLEDLKKMPKYPIEPFSSWHTGEVTGN